MDPASVTTLTVQSIGTFVKVITTLKKVAETVKDSRKDLEELLHHSERMRNMLELLRITLHELDKTKFKDMQLAIDGAGCGKTLQELLNFASSVVDKKSKLGLVNKLNWATKKAKAKSLTGQMAEQVDMILNVLIFINTYAFFD